MNVPISAFTLTSKIGIQNVLKSTVHICTAFDPQNIPPQNTIKKIKCNAIWDTGATCSFITERIITELNLPVINIINTETAAGLQETTCHLVNIELPNNVGFPGVRVAKAKIKGADVLIGMDIITRGDFAVTNFNRQTVFSFRIPSIRCIDFVKELSEIEKKQNIHKSPQTKIRSRTRRKKKHKK